MVAVGITLGVSYVATQHEVKPVLPPAIGLDAVSPKV